MFFAFFAMHLKWLCIVFALLSTLRLSEGQTFEGLDGRAYGIMYSDIVNTLVGRITGGACGSPGDYVTFDAVTTTDTDGCFVRSADQTYAGGDGEANSQLQTATTPNFVVYLAEATIDTAVATSATGAITITTVTLPSLAAGTPAFYYDCGTALNAIDGGQDYFSFLPHGTPGSDGTLSWKKALADDPILFLGRIRCLFSHQDNANYATVSTASYRVVADITIDPPLATDATITCSLNPIAANAGRDVIVGTYAYGGDTALTGPCTATTESDATETTPTTFLALQNAANCFGQVTLNEVATFEAGNIVTLTVTGTPSGGQPIENTCSYTVTADVAPPTCSSAVSGRVDLQYWRDATATATDNANVLVDKAIATSSGRALTYTIASSTKDAGHYNFVQNTLQVTAAAAKTKANGNYPIMVDAVDTQYPSLNATCAVSLTVGPQNCVP